MIKFATETQKYKLKSVKNNMKEPKNINLSARKEFIN